MTKKIVLAVLIAEIIICKSFSQENIKKDTLLSEKIMKHEIGINLTPFHFIFFGGSANYENRFVVTYRRNFNKHTSIRAVTGVSLYYITPYYNLYSYYILDRTDSTEIRYTKFNRYNPKFQLYLGYEHNWGKRKLKWFLGGDIFYSFSSTRYTESIEEYKMKTIGNNTVLWPDTIFGSKTWNTSYHRIGISPFIGIKYPLSKHFIISAHFNFDFYYTISVKTSTSTIGNINVSDPPIYRRFGSSTPGGFISDLSLIYRF